MMMTHVLQTEMLSTNFQRLMNLQILSVAVVKFGTHSPRDWSETHQGVSMEC